MIDVLMDFVTSLTVYDLIDILIISFIVYRLLLLIKGTRALYMLVSILMLLVFSAISKFIGLRTTGWVLDNFSGYLFLTIIILFQPEIRRALASFGESKFFGVSSELSSVELDEIIKAAIILANRQIGALIVLQRGTDITHYVQIGTRVDSVVTRDLLMSIFIPYSPMHDGAVIVSDGRLKYAGCILPLTKREDLNRSLGTRHRAAIGITEETDAVAIVVSEEKGSMSVAAGGNLTTELDAEMLRQTLGHLFSLNDAKKRKAKNG